MPATWCGIARSWTTSIKICSASTSYWQGGAKPGDIDWVMMQVPNGTDWLEYMLYLPADPSRAALGSADHFSPGVVSVADLQKRLEQRGWTPRPGTNPQVIGVDGKLQLDLTRPRRHPGGIHGVQGSPEALLQPGHRNPARAVQDVVTAFQGLAVVGSTNVFTTPTNPSVSSSCGTCHSSSVRSLCNAQ